MGYRAIDVYGQSIMVQLEGNLWGYDYNTAGTDIIVHEKHLLGRM